LSLDPVTAVADVVGSLIERFIPDPAQQQQAKLAFAQMQQASQLGQLAVDQAEAASSDPFTSRARPFIIWVCGFALLWTFLVAPAVLFACQFLGHPVPKLPAVDDHLWELMGTMLGMGGWHAYESVQTAKARG
jgi:hypothetical protein